MKNEISENIGNTKKKDKRKRIRCKYCKKRVNLRYWKDEKGINFRCPKCLKTYTHS